MLRSLQGAQTGLVFFSPPSRRQRLARRRTAIVAAVLALAAASATIGVLSGVGDTPAATSVYIPSR